MHVHVHTGHHALIESLFVVLGSAVKVVDVLNIVPVAHHEAFEAPFAAQHVGHKPRISMGWHAVNLVVARHQRQSTGIDTGLERREKHLADSALRTVEGCTVSAVFGLAAANEVLDAGQNVVLAVEIALIAFHLLYAHAGNEQGILAEGFAAASPAGVAGNLHIGVESPVHIHSPHLASGLPRDLVCHIGIERARKADVGRIDGVVRGVGIAVDSVDTEDDGYGQTALHCLALQLIGFFHREDMEERAYFAFSRKFKQVFRHEAGVEGLRGICEQVFFGKSAHIRAEMLHSDTLVHLPDLFFERHSAKKVFDSLFYRRLGVLIKHSAYCKGYK